MHSKAAPRRRHGAELKAKVLAECEEPGASVAAVAQSHGLNANLVHKWRRERSARRQARTRRRPSTTRWRARSWRCSCRHRPTPASGAGHPHRAAPRRDDDHHRVAGRRRPASAPRGCASGCGDPHRRGVAGRRARRHARRRRPAARARRAGLRRCAGAPRLPVRQRARHAHQAAGARRLRRVVRGAAAEPGRFVWPRDGAARGAADADAGAVRRAGARACPGSAASR